MFAKITAKLKGYRTMISSGLITVAGAISALPDILQTSGVSWQNVLSEEVKSHASLIIMCISLFFGFMRIISTTPVGMPEGAPEPPSPKTDNS